MNVNDIRKLFQSELSSLYEKNELHEIISLAFEAVKSFSKTDLITKGDVSITGEEQNQFQRILAELKTNKPIQYVLGYNWFYGIKFHVNENVLIPRLETEELVHWIINELLTTNQELPTLLDIGTGSGCIAIALKKNIPQAEVFALDISDKALEMAKKNAEANNTQINFMQVDILSIGTTNNELQTTYDIIVSNPPYIPQSDKSTLHERVIHHEPQTALFAGEDPLIFYRAIADYALKYLKANGSLFFEIHHEKGKEIKHLLHSKGFTKVEMRKDMSGKDRMIKAQNLKP